MEILSPTIVFGGTEFERISCSDPPVKVVEAAKTVKRWADEQDLKEWSVAGVGPAPIPGWYTRWSLRPKGCTYPACECTYETRCGR